MRRAALTISRKSRWHGERIMKKIKLRSPNSYWLRFWCASCSKRFTTEDGLLMHARTTGCRPIINARAISLAEAQNWRCCYCCSVMDIFVIGDALRMKGSHATVEHFVPRSSGGRNAIENLVAACQTCNTRRGTGDPLNFWLSTQPFRRSRAIAGLTP